MRIFLSLLSKYFIEHLTAYYTVWQTSIAHLSTQSQTSSQRKGIEAQIHNPERNTASQIYHAMTLPVTQKPTSGKQPISHRSTDQNTELLFDIQFPPEDNSVAGPSMFPSGTETSITKKKNKKSKKDTVTGIGDPILSLC